MRRFSKFMLVATILSALFVILPGAFAAGASIAGDVNGTVNYSGTELPLSGCAYQAYNFSGVIINGAVSGGGQTYVGTIGTAGVRGESTSLCPNGTPGETLQGGSGTVNSAASPAHFSGNIPGTSSSVSGDFYGTYVRTNSIVTVSLNILNLTINGVNTGSTTAKVAAQFTPTSFNTSTGAIKAAEFAGSFENVG